MGRPRSIYCPDCGVIKTLENTGKDLSKATGLASRCKMCTKKYKVKRRTENPEWFIKYQRAYYNKNKEKIDEYHKQHRDNNRALYRSYYKKQHLNESLETKLKRREQNKLYAKLNKESVAVTKKLWSKRAEVTNPRYLLAKRIRSRVRIALLEGYKKSSTVHLIGCSIDFLKLYLENMFVDNMSWDNYGRYGWHIDHIRPCASFDLTDPEQQKQCFHYTNLQPLWAEDNLRKGDKWDGYSPNSPAP